MNKMILQAALLWMTVTVTAGAAHADTGEWNFDVYLDNKEIGFHKFELDRVDDTRVLRSEADFKVKILFLTAFSYEHRNTEVWADGCLRSIDASTNSNGKKFQVTGVENDGQFVLQSDQGPAPVDNCVATFAYWDRELLNRDRLLNSQTGEYLDVEMQVKAPSTYQLGEREITAENLHVIAKDVDIVLTYAAQTGEWLALDSTLKNGRTLQYRRSAADLRTTRLSAITR